MNVRPQNPCPPSMQHRRSSDVAKIRGGLTVSHAIEGFILHKTAQGLSERTICSCKDILEHCAMRIGCETQVPSITSQDLKRCLVWKTTEYVSIRNYGKTHPLSPKTTRNTYVTFQAFFRWIGEEFEPRDFGSEDRSRGKFPGPMKGIPVPKFVSPPIEPFTKDEVISLIKACVQKRERRPTNNYANRLHNNRCNSRESR